MTQNFLHYTITSTLEKRSACTIYLARHDDQIARTVALKIFRKPTFTHAAQKERFLQEMEKLTHISHPNIVPILESGIEDERAYIASTYMPNGSLRVRLDRNYPQRLPAQQALNIISQIGQALVYLHARYLTHGQIKPEHILFDTNGHALLSDPYCSANPPSWVVTNENASDDFRYLAPEQFDGKRSELSDQYALCCLAYELLTGRPPFTLRDPQALEEQQRYAEPTPPRQLVSNLAPKIELALLQGLAKEPASRHADITSLLAALQQVQTSTTGNIPLPRSRRRTTSLVPPPPSSAQTSSTAFNPSRPLRPAQPTSELKASTPPVQPLNGSKASMPSASGELTSVPSDTSRSNVVPQAQARPASQPEQLSTAFPQAEEDLDEELIFSSLFDQQTPSSPSPEPTLKPQHIPPDDFNDFLREMDEADLILPAPAAQNPVLAEKFDDFLEDLTREEEPEALVVVPVPEVPVVIPVAEMQEDTGDPFNDLLQEMAFEKEMLLAANSSPAPIEAIDQDFVDVPTVTLPQQGIVILNAASISPQLPPRAEPVIATGSQASKRSPAGMILLSLLLLLMLISLLTYNALAATSSPSTTLALLSGLPNPTPKATIDALGILSPATTGMEAPPAQPTLALNPTSKAKPTPKPTPKAKPKPKATPSPTPITVPTTAPIVPISVPTPTPQPAPTAKPTPKPTPPPVPVGQTIWLKASINGKYASASLSDANAPIQSDEAQAQAWEKFRVIDAGNGLIALQSVGNGDYVSVRADTANAPLQAVATTIDDWEEFQWISLGNGNIALLSKANGDYVSNWFSTVNTPLYAMGTQISTWEVFSWGTTN